MKREGRRGRSASPAGLEGIRGQTRLLHNRSREAPVILPPNGLQIAHNLVPRQLLAFVATLNDPWSVKEHYLID